MEKLVIALLISLIPMIPAVIYALRNRNMPVESAKRLVKGLGGMNVILTLMAAGFAAAWLAFPQVAFGMSNAVAAPPRKTTRSRRWPKRSATCLIIAKLVSTAVDITSPIAPQAVLWPTPVPSPARHE